ncbi:MAG: hypothetical protein H6722_35680 [Sandaracinus sp.]|nr:hypothetical protein [Sandaracinus sp.]
MTWRLERLLCSVTRVFAADQTRAELPLRRNGAELVSEAYRMVEVGVRSDQGRYTWVGSKGDTQIGTRLVPIEALHGNELQLGAFVVGSSADAIDVRQQLWTTLGELDSQGPADIGNVHGVDTFDTTSVVKADLQFEHLLRPFQQAVQFLRERLPDPIETTPMWKVDLAFNLRVGGTSVPKVLRFERRYTSREDDCVYFIQSPLHSNEHLELLSLMFGAEGEPASGHVAEPAPLKSEAQ